MIKVKDLSFNYGKDKQALNRISFEVKEGEVFGFLGTNGSGKSTTQKILTGILKGYDGFVNIFGKEVRNCGEDFYKNIGVLFEFPYLYSNLNAVDNLKYFSSFYPEENRQDIYGLLNKLQLKTDFIKKPVSSYSKGMKQRTSLARALINNPKLLFLDEPTSGLDPSGAVLFRQIIEDEKKKGHTIFLTTHNMFDAEILCDRVAFITNGDIIAIDTPHNLRTQNSDKQIKIEFIYKGIQQSKLVLAKEIEAGIPFKYDEIISVHSQEPTLEDVFIKMTGRSPA